MRTTKLRRSALALATTASAVGLAIAAPAPAHASDHREASPGAFAPGDDSSLAARIVIGSIETDDCTYTLVLDDDGFHVEVTCVDISFD